MKLFNTKEETVGGSFYESTEKNISAFIPISCHYDEDTILDKNGNLIGVIEVTGFEHNDELFQSVNLREAVRQTIKECVQNFDVAVYLHTIRDRKNMMPSGVSPFGFAKKLNEYWEEKHNWDKQLANTLYITVVMQAPSFNKLHPKFMFKKLLKNQYFKELEKKSEILDEVLSNIGSSLKRFGAKRLGIVMDGDECTSEILEFFHSIILLRSAKQATPIRNFKDYFADFDMKYYFNTMEITDSHSSRFVAIYSLKETHNMPTWAYDSLLQMGAQFIVSEFFHKVTEEKAMKNFENAKSIAEAGRSKDLLEVMGLKEIFGKSGSAPFHCQYQSSILIYSDELNFFSNKIQTLCKKLSELGVMTVREDCNMSRVFWSQVPGNMKFVCRKKYGSISNIASFTSIHHSDLGCYNGSKWGAPITLLRNIDGNPFYFNFHKGDNGHTLLIGPEQSGKTILMRFLITQACKLQPRIIYIDLEGGADKFLAEMGGLHVKVLENEPSPVQINPFDDEIFSDKEFIGVWLKKALMLQGEAADQIMTMILEALEAKKDPDSRFEMLQKIIKKSTDKALTSGFEKLMQKETYQNFFSTTILDMFELESIVSLDLSGMKENPLLLELYLDMILKSISKLNLDNAPVILALNKAETLFQKSCMKDGLSAWMDQMMQKNVIALFSLTYQTYLQNSKPFQDFLAKVMTKLFLSNNKVDRYFKKTFDLAEWELYKIKSYDQERRMFLLKQQNISIVSNVNLDDKPEILEVLK